MSTTNREEISYIIPKENNINKNTNPAKLKSDNLIISVSMASNNTSTTNTNLIIKSKQRNQLRKSYSNIILLTNPNEKEKSSISVNNKTNNNLSRINKINNSINNYINNNNNNNYAKGKIQSFQTSMPNLKFRRDAKGIPILRGRKKHGITFRDILDKNSKLVDIVKIESYKSFNAQEILIKQDKTISDDGTSCACSIF
jgi:prolyl oligopeptidase PreP (S9A serine peptidase family)